MKIGPYELNRVHQGYAPDCLKAIPDECIHTVVTSPPYWGLRQYAGLEPQVWGGDPACKHTWEDRPYVRRTNDDKGVDSKQLTNKGTIGRDVPVQSSFCKCGVWRGFLGLEPTPEMYVEHLVEIFREVRRVLRGEGTLWLNLGDCYATHASGGKNHSHNFRTPEVAVREGIDQPKPTAASIGLKEKDLIMIPARVALALQADGWYLRSQIPWVKRNAMPEPTTDRPSSAVEYVYLFSKEEKYYFDMEAIKVKANSSEWPGIGPKHGAERDRGEKYEGMTGGARRNRRNSDWFFESWQGLWIEDEEPIAFVVNPKACSDAHFATFPIKLIEPMILAGCPERGAVLDPFAGTGTTLVAAHGLGRNSIGFDASEKYINIAAIRVEAARKGLTVPETRAGQRMLFEEEP